jgi:hypothetical protein
MATTCPIECVMELCKNDTDFIERNGTWVLSIMAVMTGCLGGVLTYLMKSRCSSIRCLGMECQRKVVEIEGGVRIDATSAV